MARCQCCVSGCPGARQGAHQEDHVWGAGHPQHPENGTRGGHVYTRCPCRVLQGQGMKRNQHGCHFLFQTLGRFPDLESVCNCSWRAVGMGGLPLQRPVVSLLPFLGAGGVGASQRVSAVQRSFQLIFPFSPQRAPTEKESVLSFLLMATPGEETAALLREQQRPSPASAVQGLC